ncbi:MAG: hypothetical protein ACHQ7H_07330 [Candidatus Rokuibacteriota bacterium]|jgi:hypothetical protein
MDKEQSGKDGKSEQGAQAKPAGLGLKLVPVADSDQPVLSNLTTVSVAPGLVFIDFGFIEPNLLAALPRMARLGGKMPDRISGKLAVRVALGFDSLSTLHQQLGQVIKGLGDAARAAKAAGAK